MKKISYTDTTGIPPRSMMEEFLCHKKGFEWWYTTGYLNDENGRLYTFQFTLSKIRVYGVKMNLIMTAVTDIENARHYYNQKAIFFEKDVIITPERVGVIDLAEMTFPLDKSGGGQLGLKMEGDGYALTLDMDMFKKPIWQCEDGVLRMGIEAPMAKTYYWSYTNLVVSGKLVLAGKELSVKGKAWFDRQGGPFNPLDRRQQWEWFSLRFFDDEEVMLFSFPHVPYHDGTLIDRDGKATRFNDFTIQPLGFTEAGGNKFSCGWQVTLKGIKDEQFTIEPKVDGQLNLFYFELLADIKNKAGKVVGYCMVELLPGVYNEKSTAMSAFARV
jgi:predicted secreted hydrolase